MSGSLRRQLGFIYLRTGANGAGKTLLTLKDVRELQLKENCTRPVYHNGRFKLKPQIEAEFGWQYLAADQWQTIQQPSIFIWDEAHCDLPVRKGGEAPEYIAKLAEHRRCGHDFFMIDQHPNNIDAFVRRLIGAPGWHQHLKRASAAPLVSVLEWSAVKGDCEKAGSGESGSVKMVPYPREVYDWYDSAELHTGKLKIPFRVWVLLACLVGFPAAVYYAVSTTRSGMAAREDKLKALSSGGSTAPGGTARQASASVASGGGLTLTPQQFVASYKPRIDGLAYTAPRFDAITQPTAAPYPAACVASKSSCHCYSQQATLLAMPVDLCRSIAKLGWFMEWDPAAKGGQPGQIAPAATKVASVAPTPPSVPSAPPSAPSTLGAAAGVLAHVPPIDSSQPGPALTEADADLMRSAGAYRRASQVRR